MLKSHCLDAAGNGRALCSTQYDDHACIWNQLCSTHSFLPENLSKLSSSAFLYCRSQVRAQIALWTSGFVLMTLLINAPLIPKLLQWTGLSEPSLIKIQIYERAKEALEDYTKKVSGGSALANKFQYQAINAS